MSTTRSRLALAALAAGIAALALPGAAFAQDDHHGDHPNGHPANAAHPAGTPQAPHPAGAVPQAGAGGMGGGGMGGGRPAQNVQPNHIIQGAPAAPVANIPGQMHPDNGVRTWQGNAGGGRPAMPAGGAGWNGGGRTDPNAPGYHRFDGQGNGTRPGGNGAPGRAGNYDPRPQGNYRAWSPQFRESWRGDARYNWRDWRDGHRDAYHLGRYYAPYGGAYYSRLSVGFVLDPAFYGSSYTISDPWTYHLPPAWAPYQWVRYYNDALLVDTYTGQVVDVLNDFFW